MNPILRYRWYRLRRKWRDAGRLCPKRKKTARRAWILALWLLACAECLTLGAQYRGEARLLLKRLLRVERGVEITLEEGGDKPGSGSERVRTYGFSLRWREGELVFYRISETLRRASGRGEGE